MVIPSPSHWILIVNILSTGFALKHLVRDRDCCKLETRTCWRSPNNVSDKQLIFHIALMFIAVKIPVIVVFTKYDLLVMEHWLAATYHLCPIEKWKPQNAQRKHSKKLLKIFHLYLLPCRLRTIKVRYWVCNQPHFFDPVPAETKLLELTQVTRDHLRDVAGSLWALWATAQQINACQKVELSIRCVSSTINVQRNYDTFVVSEGFKSKFIRNI
jgi:hypothetical protein